MVIVSPYCGLPKLSHQFPVTAVVVAVIVVGVVVVVLVLVVLVGEDVVVSVDVVVDVGVDVVVLVIQDAKTRDATMRQLSAIQITPLFILISFYL